MIRIVVLFMIAGISDSYSLNLHKKNHKNSPMFFTVFTEKYFFLSLKRNDNTSIGEAVQNINITEFPQAPKKVTHKHKDGTENAHNNVA